MRRLRLAHVFLFLSALVGVAPLARDIVSYDFWWHLRAGQYIWQTGAVPATDPFSFTMLGKAWTAHEWLFEAILWGFYNLAHYWGVLLWFFIVAVSTACVMWYLYRLQFDQDDSGRNLLLAALITIVMGSLYPFWNPRPGVLSYLLFVVFLYVLRVARHRDRPRILWVLPFLMVIWVNAHASFVLGPLLIVGELVFGIVEFRVGALISHKLSRVTRNTLLGVLPATVLASAINPHGFYMFAYTATITGQSLMKNFIAEWKSPNFHDTYFGVFVAAFLLLTLFWILSQREGDSVQDIVYVLGFLYLFLSSERYLPFLAIYIGYVVARYVPTSQVLKRIDKPAIVVPFALAFVLLLALRLPSGNLEDHIPAESFPTEALTYMDEHDLTGHIFNLYRWGGYLIWKSYPDRLVFIDGRADLYLTSDVFKDYVDTVELKVDPERVLDEYEIDYVLVPTNCSLMRYLEADGEWRVRHRDDTASILERKSQ